GRSRHRRLVERRRWRDAEARSSRTVRSPVHHSMPAARLERYRCLRLPRICHPRPEPMASCGRGYSLLVRHALSSLGALALSQRDLAWFCLARVKLPLFRCARLLALDISGAMRPKAYVISADASAAMKRREFITLLGGAAAVWPLAARAQQPDRMKRLGVLIGLAEHDPEAKARLVGFWQAFERLGWFEGRNVLVDYRYAPAGAGAQARAKELIALHPDVILTQGTPNSAALKQETSTIPVVFVGNADPISSGFVESLVRPGGNLTGFLLYEESITGKWLAMLREIAPAVRRAAIVSNPKTVPYDYFLHGAEAAAPSLGLQIVPGRVENTADIERTIESLAQVPDGGMILPPDTTTVVNRDLIIALAARHRLPAIYSLRFFVTGGGLMSYGTDFVNLFRQAASYGDRSLRGARPGDLPVQQPTKFEPAINLKTARALGLTVPPGLLVCGGGVAARGAGAAAGQAADHWFSRRDHGFDREPMGRRLRSAATRTRLDRGAYCRDRVSLGRGEERAR